MKLRKKRRARTTTRSLKVRNLKERKSLKVEMKRKKVKMIRKSPKLNLKRNKKTSLKMKRAMKKRRKVKKANLNQPSVKTIKNQRYIYILYL